MTPQDFVNWLKGFIAGSNSYNLTPKGWQELREQLSKVKESNKEAFNPLSNSVITKEILHD